MPARNRTPRPQLGVLRRHVSHLSELLKRTSVQVKLVLDSRVWRCADDCPGWFFGDNGPERCDDCATHNGYAKVLCDEDVALLPEAVEPREDPNQGALRSSDGNQIIAWLRANVTCRPMRVPELADKEAVKLAAVVLGASPTWVAERMVGRG